MATKDNLFYFEADTMKGLYQVLEAWQQEHQRRLVSTSIQPDGGRFCCIALSAPTEVILVAADGSELGTTGHSLDVVVYGETNDEDLVPLNVDREGVLRTVIVHGEECGEVSVTDGGRLCVTVED